ncbi:MAG: SGNH/GDSL hydrolase family protein [Oligoflexia bacterium]|nr:SGNH/GDSL hydrolase family protein [Oligoflexia bacterium]
MRRTPLVSLLVPVIALFLPLPKASAKPLLMAVLGDSISAATLADVPFPPPATSEEGIKRLSEDGVKADVLLENKFRYSWASGRLIRSQYRLLKRHLRRSGERRALLVYNVAVPGAETGDLPKQAKRIAEEMEKGEHDELAYVTILIGSNDSCARRPGGETPIATMRANLLRTFAILASVKQRKRIPILLVGIPRIPDLGEEAIRNSRTLLGLTCEKVRNDILNLCNSMLRWKTPEEYDRNMLVVEDRNRLLRLLAREVSLLYPQLDVFYSNRLYHLGISTGVLAADCFHPNKDAQEIISLQVWSDQPWFKERKPR